MESSKEIVLITGITGYIGSHIGKAIIDNCKGKYKIRASVRSINNQKKLKPLEIAFGQEAFKQIEFVEADLTDKDSIFNAVKGCSYIVHVASSIPGSKGIKDEVMIKTAKDGMNHVLEAAVKHHVKKIVVTSSFSTLIGGHWKRDQEDHYYSEKDFAPMKGADGYSQSKITQEQAILKFNEEQDQMGLKEEEKIQIVTLHPTFVIGPTIISEENSSAAGIAKFLKGEVPGVPKLMTPCVDVRDVAFAHYLALEMPGLHKQRILINQCSFWWKEIMLILQTEFKQYGYKVTTKEIGYCPLKLASLFMSQAKIILPQINSEIYARNELSQELLGMKYERDLKKSFIEMGYSLIEQGLVQDKIHKSSK